MEFTAVTERGRGTGKREIGKKGRVKGARGRGRNRAKRSKQNCW